MYVADRDTFSDTYCALCGRLADVNAQGQCEDCATGACHNCGAAGKTLNADFLCTPCRRDKAARKVKIAPAPMPLTVVVRLYEALDADGQQEIFWHLTPEDAETVAKEIQARHKGEKPCTCFACLLPSADLL